MARASRFTKCVRVGDLQNNKYGNFIGIWDEHIIYKNGIICDNDIGIMG
jgi:hypothetical protein